MVLLQSTIVHDNPLMAIQNTTNSSDKTAKSIVVRDCLGYQLVPKQ